MDQMPSFGNDMQLLAKTEDWQRAPEVTSNVMAVTITPDHFSPEKQQRRSFEADQEEEDI